MNKIINKYGNENRRNRIRLLVGAEQRFRLCAAFFILHSLLFISCNDIVDYADGYTPADQLPNTAAPTIQAVYDVSDTERLTPITEGTLGQLVVIVGQNLNHVQRICFNTVECDLNETYTAATQAVVRIPSTLSKERVNKIEYTTDKGSTTYDFVIPFPKLTVSRLSNEFVVAGAAVTVYGRNFDLYDFNHSSTVSIEHPDGYNETVPCSDISAESMTLTIPDNAPDDSHLVFSWQDTEGISCTKLLPFRPSSMLLYGDMSELAMNVDGSVQVEKEMTDGLWNLHFTGSYGAWSWNTIDLSRNMIDGIEVDNTADYVLKFELMNAQNFPLTNDTGLQFAFNWGESYAWNPADGLGINTFGLWQTVSLPLQPMATNGIKTPGEWQTLRIVFQPHTDYNADFRLANLRIVKAE